MKSVLFAFLALFAFGEIYAHELRGRVLGRTGDGETALKSATVRWINTKVGTLTDAGGNFELELDGISDMRIIVSYIGFGTDTVQIGDEEKFYTVVLSESVTKSGEAVVEGEYVTGAKHDDIQQSYVISSDEFRRAACCDLSGCMETSSAVQPVTTNFITNAKELRIAGLSGVYNQVLIDGLPMVQGLSYTYGISSFPATLIENIFIVKGANSVLQGFEAMTGIINVVLKDPDETEKVFLNGYINNFMERQVNGSYAAKLGDWSSLLAAHFVQPSQSFDRDQDNFLDLPKLSRAMLFNRWKYAPEDSRFSGVYTLRYWGERRVGGGRSFSYEQRGSSSVYGQTVSLQQPEFFSKSIYALDAESQVALMASGFLQEQESYFGTTKYNARQQNAYANLQYELNWAETHSLKAGLSFRFMNLRENIGFTDSTLRRGFGGEYFKAEQIPGVFAENIFSWDERRLELITGLRLDRHNSFGLFVTPRAVLKYNVTELLTARLTGGTGWRTANIFSENATMLASSRSIIFAERLQPEQAFNWGLNLSQLLSWEGVAEATLTADFYQTSFTNQIFPDYDSDPSTAIIRNFSGESVSNSAFIEADVRFFETLNIRTGYTFLDVYQMIGGEKRALPFNSAHKVLAAFSYSPEESGWQFDVNIHWLGRQRLPSTLSNPQEYRREAESAPYTVFNGQVTKTISDFEVYLGVENIFDFRQNRPITSWENPFGQYFDTSFVWGPTRGREIYLGVRYMLE